MTKSYKIILFFLIGVIISSLNSNADIGSTRWIFPDAHKGYMYEIANMADFDTKFYLLNPNSQNCIIVFRFYYDNVNQVNSSQIALLPNIPKIISLKDDIPQLSSFDKKFSVEIESVEAGDVTVLPFIAYKMEEWTTNSSEYEGKQIKQGALASKGAMDDEPALTWYFPSCQTNDEENKEGCTNYRAQNQGLLYKTKYFIYFEDHTVQPSEQDSIPLNIKHLGENGVIDELVVNATSTVAGSAIRQYHLNEPLSTNVCRTMGIFQRL